MKNKFICLLIGPKRSGKSFIRTLMEEEFGIKFIRVEGWVKQLKRDRQIDNQSYLNDSFRVIESGIGKTLKTNDKIKLYSC